MLRQDPDADVPGCNADDEGENDRSLIDVGQQNLTAHRQRLSDRVAANTLFLALVASVALAAMPFASFARDPFDADYLGPNQAGAFFFSFLTALLGLWGVAVLVPATINFVCEPLVPWQLSIAVFGAFGMSWLFTAAKLRTAHDWAGPLIHMAFFWIAPFYGFFHPPWFLAQTIAMPCPDRPLAQAIVVALGMLVAALAGRQTAKWVTR